ncbi:hypothetical protein JCM11641_005254 [Rhodosporidiobolus odoratus]
MNDTITILTADNPPVSLTASRVHLIANSEVFADMLSLPSSTSQDNSVTVTEGGNETRACLEVLAGEGDKKESELGKLDKGG